MDIHILDLIIFIAYLVFMLGIGFYFFKKNKSKDDYYVGGRNMSAGHIGLSVVATDVGGGFSIGLGGLGFLMGLSGSWMLFTGLLGAWISAVFLIPKVYPIAKKQSFLTFPESLTFHYNAKVALMAASGNLTTDIFGYFNKSISIKKSQAITFIIGGLAILLATMMQNVLELMLYSYAFMVSGLLVPVLGSLILKKPSSKAAFYAMIAGGGTTLLLIISKVKLPFELDANFFGITAALLIFISIQHIENNKLKWQN